MTAKIKPEVDVLLRGRIGSSIRSARDARGLTQGELAGELGVSQGQISKYEAGSDLPAIEILIAMASRLGVSLDLLVGIKEATGMPTVIMRHGTNPNETVSGKDQIRIPMIGFEAASRWKAIPLAAKDVCAYVYAPLFHFKGRENHRIACIKSKMAKPPLLSSDSIVALDFTDVPLKAIKGTDRGLFLARNGEDVQICRAIICGASIVMGGDFVRCVDIRRHKSPLIGRVVWVCQPTASLADVVCV